MHLQPHPLRTRTGAAAGLMLLGTLPPLALMVTGAGGFATFTAAVLADPAGSLALLRLALTGGDCFSPAPALRPTAIGTAAGAVVAAVIPIAAGLTAAGAALVGTHYTRVGRRGTAWPFWLIAASCAVPLLAADQGIPSWLAGMVGAYGAAGGFLMAADRGLVPLSLRS